jgi:hypothetical protein
MKILNFYQSFYKEFHVMKVNVLSRLKIIESDADELLKSDSYEIYKTDNGWYNVRRKESEKGKVPVIYSVRPFKTALKAVEFLNTEIWKHNTKNIMNIRKQLIAKLHKLFKAAGMKKSKDMPSRIRGYRPITEHGYDLYTYSGDRTRFYIGFTTESIKKEYKPKILKILDSEGIKYTDSDDIIEVDMREQ